jgi:hypothetical protein
MEPATRGEDVFFHWDVLPRTQAVPVARWQALAVPWRDLRGALGAAGVAAWRLVRALAGIAVAPRPQRWPGPRVPA